MDEVLKTESQSQPLVMDECVSNSLHSSQSLPLEMENTTEGTKITEKSGEENEGDDNACPVSEKQRTDSVGIETEELDENQKAAKEQKELFEAKKLSLVLDLDHTLLHSVKYDNITSDEDNQMLENKFEEDKELFCENFLQRWVKFRPGIWNFLKEASKLYKLHICTMGGELYAILLAKLLDPTGELFEGRVISGQGNKTKDLKGVLGLKSTTIIMDDTFNVWPHHTENLILVDKYGYFPCVGERHNIPEEEQNDGVLESCLKRIKMIHSSFYSNPPSLLHNIDVTSILAAEKCRVLAGCHVHFTADPLWEDNLEKHPLWQTALQLGATCTTEEEVEVTHVVSQGTGTVEGTDLTTGRFVVSTRWIEAAAILLSKPNETEFSIT